MDEPDLGELDRLLKRAVAAAQALDAHVAACPVCLGEDARRRPVTGRSLGPCGQIYRLRWTALLTRRAYERAL